MIVFSLIVIIITLLYVYVHLTEKSRQIERMFPGPFRTPIIGTLILNVFRRKTRSRKCLSQLYNHRPYRLWFGNTPYIIISDYRTAKIILSQSKFNDKAEPYEAFIPLVGRNHLLGTGETWQRYRKHATNAFRYRELNNYLKIIGKNCDTLCQIWRIHAGKEAFNIQKSVSMYIMDNLTESFTGETWHWQTDPNLLIVKAMEDLTKIFQWRIMLPILGVNWIFNLTPLRRLQNEAIKVGREYSQILLQSKKDSIARQQSLNDGSIDEDEDEESSDQDPLTKFIKTNEFTDEEIKTEIASVIFAGFESVTGTICFALHAMAKHEEIQEKVHKEIKTILEESDSWPSLNDLNKMVYTDQVLCETLRLYTPFQAIGRYIKEDVHINDQQFIPKNTNVVITLSGIHNDPVTWPNPRVFDPERFTQENNKKRDPCAFMPFSVGPRKCSGYKFAMAEMKLTIAKVVQLFKISLSDKPEDKVKPVRNMGLTISSRTGFNIKLQLRDEKN